MGGPVDQSARKWGAVNTVRFEGKDPDEKWFPWVAEDPNAFHTTEVWVSIPMQMPLRLPSTRIWGFLERVALFGRGGAGRAALKLAESGGVLLINRTASKAMAIAEELRGAFRAGLPRIIRSRVKRST